MNKPIRLRATSVLQSYARYLAEARMSGHNHCRRSYEDLSNGNRQADYYGDLGELVCYQWLERLGEKPQYELLSGRATRRPDCLLRGRPLEIKSSPPGREDVNINAGQHDDPAYLGTGYLLCLFTAQDAVMLSTAPQK